MLFIIPGIVASYKYRMAIYIQIDNPEYSASECIRISKEMMMGHKAELFVLELSFIGWALLTIIPFVSLYVLPYIETTTANFYNVLLSGGASFNDAGSWNNHNDWEGCYKNCRDDEDPWNR